MLMGNVSGSEHREDRLHDVGHCADRRPSSSPRARGCPQHQDDREEDGDEREPDREPSDVFCTAASTRVQAMDPQSTQRMGSRRLVTSLAPSP